jgi:hypothetical protein
MRYSSRNYVMTTKIFNFLVDCQVIVTPINVILYLHKQQQLGICRDAGNLGNIVDDYVRLSLQQYKNRFVLLVVDLVVVQPPVRGNQNCQEGKI